MPSARRRSDPVVWGLAALVVWALALRVWFATPELHSGRFWDERYGLENVEAHLRHGQWLPANAYHPTLSYLPQLAVLGAAHGLARVAEDPAFAVLAPRFGFTPLGYLLARLVQTVFGALSIVWLYRVGRRLFDPPTALLAAAAMAVVPWHLRQSVIFKPDVLMLWLLLVAFEAALAAYERPRPAGFARAGLAVGLTAAAKFNGAAAALPLAIGWIAGPGRRRGLAGLALAGVVTVAVFLALDPHLLLRPELLADDFGHTLRDYAAKGAEAAATRADVALHAVRSLLGVSFHGPVVGAVGLAGLLWMAVAAARAEPERRRRLAMAAGFPLGYLALYLAVTNNPSEHNWLPIVPFTSLGAAVLAVAAGRAATARLPAGARRRLLPAAALAAVLPL
ncbi:MAG TPA: glycosyltransferase family 39 protein, partial [Thermoanaerobaculia bacterium]|nr:glycosyltransferase family 39 protein [Thermoanaerobaculia bacterium]